MNRSKLNLHQQKTTKKISRSTTNTIKIWQITLMIFMNRFVLISNWAKMFAINHFLLSNKFHRIYLISFSISKHEHSKKKSIEKQKHAWSQTKNLTYQTAQSTSMLNDIICSIISSIEFGLNDSMKLTAQKKMLINFSKTCCWNHFASNFNNKKKLIRIWISKIIMNDCKNWMNSKLKFKMTTIDDKSFLCSTRK